MISPEEIAHHYSHIQHSHRNDRQFGDEIGMDATFVFLIPHVSNWIESFLSVQNKTTDQELQQQAKNQIEYVYFVYSQLPSSFRLLFIELIIPRLKEEFFTSYDIWERQPSEVPSQQTHRVPVNIRRLAHTLGLF